MSPPGNVAKPSRFGLRNVVGLKNSVCAISGQLPARAEEQPRCAHSYSVIGQRRTGFVKSSAHSFIALCRTFQVADGLEQGECVVGDRVFLVGVRHARGIHGEDAALHEAVYLLQLADDGL